MRFLWGPMDGYMYLSQGNIFPGEPTSMVSWLRAETVWQASLGLFPRCTATPKHTHSPAYFAHSGATPETPPCSSVVLGSTRPWTHSPGKENHRQGSSVPIVFLLPSVPAFPLSKPARKVHARISRPHPSAGQVFTLDVIVGKMPEPLTLRAWASSLLK